MIKKLKDIIITFFLKRGYVLIGIDEYRQKCNYYREVMNENKTKEDKIETIVFSKNRAIQLYAFLESYIENVNNYGKVYVLYKTTTEKHEKSYNQLKHLFQSKNFIFIEENDFRNQLISILKNSNAKTIGLFVDDMIFLNKIDYKSILKINTLENVVALSRGRDMDYSVVLQKKIEVPKFSKIDDKLFKFSWNEIAVFSDWTYPLGVSGYFYGRDEFYVMINQQSFKAPNSLESSMQTYLDFFTNRNGVCYETISCCCIHANIVQTECVNPTLGEFSVDDLLFEWESGKKIDLSQFYNKNGNVAQIQKYSFIKRS